MTGFDLSAYLGVFLDELDEQLQILDTEILKLEKEPANVETIQNIFRAAHTLKGSSAAMGFEKLKDFTHHLENVFELIRQQKLTVTAHLVNIIFTSIDVIKQLKEAVITNELEQIDITQFIKELEQLSNENHLLSDVADEVVEVHLNEHHTGVISTALALGHGAFTIRITLEKEALMKSVRALLIHNQLIEVGEIIASFPSIELAENEKEFDGQITFILITMRTKEEMEALLRDMTDVACVEVEPLRDDTLPKEHVITPVDETSKEKTVQPKAKIASTVRVDVDKLEHLMNLVGELVIDQTRLVDVRGRFAQKNTRDESEFELLDEVTNHLSRVISELQEGMMKTRMLPIEQLFNRFPRMVRDTAMKANKEIVFDMQGKETELDRTLIEEISDPIIHLLRNAIDHGIESPEERVKVGKTATGHVTLRAEHEENNVVISITDDGRGIDPARIKRASVEKGIITEEEAQQLSDKDAMFLIFKSGISTAEKITDISGRGVGMDIVNSHIEKLNGIIDITSVVGEGTTFTVKLPLTLAIIRSLLVKFGEKTFAIPLVNVLEIIRLNKEDIQIVKNQEVGMVRGRILPLVRMKERLGVEGDMQVEKKREFVVVIGIADKRIGLIADKTIGNQEIVIKSLGSYIGSPQFISGATIMGDGNVALILDVSSVVREYGSQVLEQDDSMLIKAMEDEQQLVTFKLATEEYAIEIQRAKDIIAVPNITQVVETPEELLGIINLRGNMLPVIDLRKRFKLPEAAWTKKSRIIIVEQGAYDVGFLVDEVTQVLKINNLSIEEPKEAHQYNASNLLRGISKLDNRIVLILDFDEIIASLNFDHAAQIVSH